MKMLNNEESIQEQSSINHSCQKIMINLEQQQTFFNALQGDTGRISLGEIHHSQKQDQSVNFISYDNQNNLSEQNQLQLQQQNQSLEITIDPYTQIDQIELSQGIETIYSMKKSYKKSSLPKNVAQLHETRTKQKTYEEKDQEEEESGRERKISTNKDSDNTDEDYDNLDISNNNNSNMLQIYPNTIKLTTSVQKKLKDNLSASHNQRNKNVRRANISLYQKNKVQWMIMIRKHTLAFVQKLKQLKRNKRVESMSMQEIELINDYSVYMNSNNNYQNTQLFKLFDKWMKSCSFIPLFMPTNLWRVFWDIFQTINTYIFFFIFSILIFFNQAEKEFQQLYTYSLFFLMLMVVDMLINMNTAFFIKDTVVVQRNLIIKEYILSILFLTDFISGFILFQKIMFRNEPMFYNPNHDFWRYFENLMIFMKLNSVSQKRKRFENLFTLKNYYQLFYRLLNQIFSVLVIAHIEYLFLGNFEIFLKYYFFLASIGWYLVGLIQQLNDQNKLNWLQVAKIDHEVYYNKYIYSFYWAITTMTTVGYGDISANNSTEALYISISMILFSIVFAYSINNIGLILQDIDKLSRQLQDNIQIIQKYLKRKNVNIQLKSRVRYYLRFLHEEQKDINRKEEDQILSLLSNKLREEITVEVNSKILKSSPIFNLFSEVVRKKLVFIMKETLVYPNEIIFNEGDYDDQSIYLIQNGIIQICQSQINKDKNVLVLQTLTKDDQFGELSFFTAKPRTATVRSVNLSTIYRIDRDEFIDLIKDHKQDFEKFKQIQDDLVFLKDLNRISTKCYSCHSIGHTAIQCPKIHQKFDAQFLILKDNFSVYQQRSLYHRNLKQKVQARGYTKINEVISKEIQQNLEDCSDFDYEQYLKQLENNYTSSDYFAQCEEEMSSQGSEESNTQNVDQFEVQISQAQTKNNIQTSKSENQIQTEYYKNTSLISFDKKSMRKKKLKKQNPAEKLIPENHSDKIEHSHSLQQIGSPQNTPDVRKSLFFLDSNIHLTLHAQTHSYHYLHVHTHLNSPFSKIIIQNQKKQATQFKKELSTVSMKKIIGQQNNINLSYQIIKTSKNQTEIERNRIQNTQQEFEPIFSLMNITNKNGSDIEKIKQQLNNMDQLSNYQNQQNDSLCGIKQNGSYLNIPLPEDRKSRASTKSRISTKDRSSLEVKTQRNSKESNYNIDSPIPRIKKSKQYWKKVYDKLVLKNTNNNINNNRLKKINNTIFCLPEMDIESKKNNNHQQNILNTQEGLKVQTQQQKGIEKLQKIIKIDTKQSVNEIYQQQQQFSYNLESMQLYTYYYPLYNYNRVIRQFITYQMKQKKLFRQKIKETLKIKRPNLMIHNRISIKRTNSEVISQLAKNNKKQNIDFNSYRPTNLSYGTSQKGYKLHPKMLHSDHFI